VSDRTLILLGAVIAAGQVLTGFVLGRIGDTAGHKRGAVVGATAQAGALVIALSWPGAWSCTAAFALLGVAFASAWISHMNLLFETCPHDCRMAHITVSNLVLAPVTAVIPMATGQALILWGAAPVMVSCVAVTLLGLAWLLVMVREPRTVPV
jgi:MFS family permease